MNLFIKRILLADDDAEDIDIFRQAFHEIDPQIQLSIAQDGEELLYLLEKGFCPDLVILDVNMPKKTGPECLASIRLQDQFNDVPVIMLSTSSVAGEVEGCITKGASWYYAKPETYAELLQLIRKIISAA